MKCEIRCYSTEKPNTYASNVILSRNYDSIKQALECKTHVGVGVKCLLFTISRFNRKFHSVVRQKSP